MIRTFRSAAIALCFGVFACPPVTADAQEMEGFSGADRVQVEARMDQLDRSMASGDLAAAMEVIPPRMLRTIATRAGATEDELKAAVREMLSTRMQGLTFVSYDMDLAAAAPLRTPDGSRTYLLIPTSTVIEFSGTRVRSNTSTLALEDEGEWYLVRIDDQSQVAIVKELWPEFAPIQFPAGTRELIP